MGQTPSSPRTRADFQQAVRDLFEPLVPYYEAGGARLAPGETGATYDEASEALEAFARPLWGIVPLVAGGGEFAHWHLIRAGLANGTDPDHPQYWGAVGATPGGASSTDQRMVEMAAIGLALAMVPEEFFEPLTAGQKQNVLDWLSPINTIDPSDNNWQFFRVLVNLGLERIGGPTDWGAVERSFATVEANYLGDGWYQDGQFLQTTDFYVAFAFHYYSLIYAHLAEGRDPQRAALFRERAREFAPDWAARFDSSGRVIAYGRSMTYRFAGAGFFGALALADVEAIPWATMRGLWAKHLRWWFTRNITNGAGILTIGWGYGNLLMSESYNAPGSPYWALKAFLPLALPAEHPFWMTEEDDGAGTGELHRPQPLAHVVVNRTDAQSQMLNAGGHGFWFPRQAAAKYGKFAYSSAFPLALEPDAMLSLATAESNLAFLDVGSGQRQTRLGNTDSGVAGSLAWARWSVFGGAVQVATVMMGEGDTHVRLHVVDTTRPVTALEGGYAIEYRYDPGVNEYRREEANEPDSPSRALVANGHATSLINDPIGIRAAEVKQLQPNTGLLWPRATAPMLTGQLESGRHVLICSVAANEKPSMPVVDISMCRAAELWEMMGELLGESIECPAFR